MIITLILAATAAEAVGKMVGPIPRNDPNQWVTVEDFSSGGVTQTTSPRSVISNGSSESIQGAVPYTLLLDAKGMITGCVAKAAIPDAQPLETRTCELLRSRARFAPALDMEGNPIAGVYRSRAYWVAAGREAYIAKLPPENADLTFALGALPAGLASPTNVGVYVLVGADGKAEACVVAPTDPKSKIDPAQEQARQSLGRQGCAAGLAAFKLNETLDKKQVPPPRSVRTAIIRFGQQAP